MSYSSWSVVFGEQPSAAKWNILGTNDAYFDSLIGAGTAWTSYSPSWVGGSPAIGNGTLTGKYQKLGKNVRFRIELITGSTTTFGSTGYSWSLPVTAASMSTDVPIGTAFYNNGGVSQTYIGTINCLSSTTLRPYFPSSPSSTEVLAMTNTVPNTFVHSSQLYMSGEYEAA